MGYFKNEFEYQQFLQKKQEARKREVEAKDPDLSPAMAGCDDEIKFHKEIITYCNKQWPRWKYIYSRPDMPATIGAGIQDFTVFLPGCKLLCIECKKRDGKLSDAQRNWKHEMKRLGHEVHIVRSMEEFLVVVAAAIVDLKVALASPDEGAVS